MFLGIEKENQPSEGSNLELKRTYKKKRGELENDTKQRFSPFHAKERLGMKYLKKALIIFSNNVSVWLGGDRINILKPSLDISHLI